MGDDTIFGAAFSGSDDLVGGGKVCVTLCGSTGAVNCREGAGGTGGSKGGVVTEFVLDESLEVDHVFQSSAGGEIDAGYRTGAALAGLDLPVFTITSGYQVVTRAAAISRTDEFIYFVVIHAGIANRIGSRADTTASSTTSVVAVVATRTRSTVFVSAGEGVAEVRAALGIGLALGAVGQASDRGDAGTHAAPAASTFISSQTA